MAYEYIKWFLVVEGGSGLWIISVYGLHFPREQLTRLTPIFARLLSPLCGFRAGIASLLSVQENLAKTIARDKPVSTLNVLANIMNTGII